MLLVFAMQSAQATCMIMILKYVGTWGVLQPAAAAYTTHTRSARVHDRHPLPAALPCKHQLHPNASKGSHMNHIYKLLCVVVRHPQVAHDVIERQSVADMVLQNTAELYRASSFPLLGVSLAQRDGQSTPVVASNCLEPAV